MGYELKNTWNGRSMNLQTNCPKCGYRLCTIIEDGIVMQFCDREEFPCDYEERNDLDNRVR